LQSSLSNLRKPASVREKVKSGGATKQQVIDWMKGRTRSKGKRGSKSLATGEQE